MVLAAKFPAEQHERRIVRGMLVVALNLAGAKKGVAPMVEVPEAAAAAVVVVVAKWSLKAARECRRSSLGFTL